MFLKNKRDCCSIMVGFLYNLLISIGVQRFLLSVKQITLPGKWGLKIGVIQLASALLSIPFHIIDVDDRAN
jgi:hypothetical protein